MQDTSNHQMVELTNGETLSIDQLASYLDSLADDRMIISVTMEETSREEG